MSVELCCKTECNRTHVFKALRISIEEGLIIVEGALVDNIKHSLLVQLPILRFLTVRVLEHTQLLVMLPMLSCW